VFLKKKTAGSASGGYEWDKDGATIEVPDALGEELLERRDGQFEQVDPPEGQRPSDEAKSDRYRREVAERQAAKARTGNESPSGTRLQDGRWAQTDTKGDEPVDTGLRDTGAEMAPANVMTGSTHPFATVTPGSSENKLDRPQGPNHPAGDEVQHPGVRHEMAGTDQRPSAEDARPGDRKDDKSDDTKSDDAKGDDGDSRKPATPQQRPQPGSSTRK